jgi:integral membrane sensor domain MASE1
MLLASVATSLACMVSLALKTMDDEISPIWLVEAVLLAQMMVARPQQRYGVLAAGVLGNFATRLFVGSSLGVSLSYSFADLVGVVSAAGFAPHISTAAELIRPKPLVRFLVGCVLFSTIASGLVAVTLLGEQDAGSRLPTMTTWFVSHALGCAIFTPTAVAFWSGELAKLSRTDQRGKNGVLLLLVCVVTTGVFGQNQFHLLYWALPPIALLAFQAELAAVLLGLLLCLAIAMWFTMHGLGPFWIEPFGSTQGRIFGLQLYYMAALAIALPISASQAQRNRLIARLRDGERRYQVLAENATDIVVSMRLDGRLTYVSPRVTPVLGYAPRET